MDTNNYLDLHFMYAETSNHPPDIKGIGLFVLFNCNLTINRKYI